MGQAPSSSSLAAPAPVRVASARSSGPLDVELEIVSAQGIAAGDMLELGAVLKGRVFSSDAYVVIEVDGQRVAWTRPIFSTLEPVWNEVFHFTNVRPDAVCKLFLLDKDVSADDPLGSTQFTAVHTEGTNMQFELSIHHRGKRSGSILVRVRSQEAAPSYEPFVRQYGPVRFSEHLSVATAIVTASMTDQNALQSSAYHVQLQNIQTYLPKDHEWNHDYPTIQPIFSPDRPQSSVLRMAIQAEHALIYKHDPKTIYGLLHQPTDFFALIHDGKRLDKPVLFTYAITNGGWYFSETGASFFKDMLSKHMLHSGAAFSVKYAGEFRVEWNLFGQHKLVIDNNSGTYAPPKEDLPRLKALLESNFPGMQVEALDQADPELQKGRKEVLDAWA